MHSQCSVSQRGFSLIEVLIALAVLGVGVFALVQTQGVSLRNTALASDIADVTTVVRSEIELRRFSDAGFVPDEDEIGGIEPSVISEGLACRTATESGWTGSCDVTLTSCNFSLGASDQRASMTCDLASENGVTVERPVAFVRVTGSSVRGTSLQLETFGTGIFVSGGVFEEEEGGGD